MAIYLLDTDVVSIGANPKADPRLRARLERIL
jgi:hypothetical protein